MRMPPLAAVVERRLLVNYRVDPDVARTLLPAPLEPQLVDGSAVAGICLLRLGVLRPAVVPFRIGWGAENAAHRIAVTWEDGGTRRSGVFVPYRHSASVLPVLAGGRLFPGVHHSARFEVDETAERVRVALIGRPSDRVETTDVDVDVRIGGPWTSALFPTLAAASEFFRRGSVGLSPSRDDRRLERMVLSTDAWHVEAATALSVRSSFFDRLPAGSAELDSVLIMRDVPVTWSAPGDDMRTAYAVARR